MRRGSVFGGLAAVLGAAALAAGCVAVLNLGPEPDDWECGVEHRYDGARYLPRSLGMRDPPRQPRGVRVVGEAQRMACGKVIGHDDAYQVAGVSPKVAVVIDGYLLVRRGATPPRQLLVAAARPIHCAGPTSFVGEWQGTRESTGLEGARTDGDDSFIRPYRLLMEATDGDHSALGRWQRLHITIEITAQTELSPEDEREAAYQLVPFEVTARCDGHRFVADRIELHPRTSETR